MARSAHFNGSLTTTHCRAYWEFRFWWPQNDIILTLCIFASDWTLVLWNEKSFATRKLNFCLFFEIHFLRWIEKHREIETRQKNALTAVSLTSFIQFINSSGTFRFVDILSSILRFDCDMVPSYFVLISSTFVVLVSVMASSVDISMSTTRAPAKKFSKPKMEKLCRISLTMISKVVLLHIHARIHSS